MKNAIYRLFTATFLLVTTPLVFSADSYVGIEGGWSHSNFHASRFAQELSSIFGSNVAHSSDEIQTSWRVFMGKNLNDSFKLELGIFSGQDYKAHFTSSQINYRINISQISADLSLLYLPFQNTSLDGFFVKVGTHFTELVSEGNGSFNNNSLSAANSERGTGLLAGLGYELPVNDQIHLRATYTYLNDIAGINRNNQNAHLGLIFDF